jgi:REP element-mobilizing transposase RayT
MPRTARLDLPGLLQHVIVRGIEQRDIFLDDQDRGSFRKRLFGLLKEMETQCYAWALIPNHFHLLLKPTHFPLSSLMRRLLTGYAVTFNLSHQRSGHLFQNRYKSIVCEKESYLLELIRYIHLNPLRAGLVNNLAELDYYPWCGHAVLMGNQRLEGQEIREVLQHFSQRVHWARRKYREFLIDGVSMGRQKELVGGGMKRSHEIRSNKGAHESFDARVLGSGEFVDSLWKREELRGKIKRVLTLREIVDRVAIFLNLKAEEILRPSKKRQLAEGRGIVSYLAVREMGYKCFEVGKELRLGPAGVSIAMRRGEVLFGNKPEIKRKLMLGLEK